MLERQFKLWIRKNWSGWLNSYEPRKGATIGIPDIQVLVRGALVPIELKVGVLVGEVLKTKKVRASQINWHHKFSEAGGMSLVMVGVGEGTTPTRIFFCYGKAGAGLRSPVMAKSLFEIPVDDFDSFLWSWLEFRLGRGL